MDQTKEETFTLFCHDMAVSAKTQKKTAMILKRMLFIVFSLFQHVFHQIVGNKVQDMLFKGNSILFYLAFKLKRQIMCLFCQYFSLIWHAKIPQNILFLTFDYKKNLRLCISKIILWTPYLPDNPWMTDRLIVPMATPSFISKVNVFFFFPLSLSLSSPIQMPDSWIFLAQILLFYLWTKGSRKWQCSSDQLTKDLFKTWS